MRATVVVCTRNRRALLVDCLASLDGSDDVVVVDNGSTDGTASWLARWAAEDPTRRQVVTEPVAGLSRARNAGVDAATGDIVLFLDDDALAPAGWVAGHMAVYAQAPATAAVGGPVVLTWPDGRPRWLTGELEHWFSALDHGAEPRPFPPPHGPYGTNMSVRREVLLAIGGFDEQLGRRGRSLLSSEEAELWQRLWAAGHPIVYQPATKIQHRVAAARLRRSWVLRRGWGQGRSNARLQTMGWNGQATRGQLAATCRVEAGFAVRFARQTLRSLARLDQPAVVDEAARCAGHTSAVAEHLWLWASPRSWCGNPR
ncbi:MAG TPA: glycosyltransferase family A protein [Acidimicrobiales bacterium]|jgi:glycosyltransferase involved in cell wall biosynthesis